jgi:hypothetical protein
VTGLTEQDIKEGQKFILTLLNYYNSTTWKASVLPALNKPPKIGDPCIIVCCWLDHCNDDNITPNSDDYDLTPGDSAAIFYHVATRETAKMHKYEKDKLIIGIGGCRTLYGKEKTFTSWVSALGYLAGLSMVYRILVITCTQRECKGIGAHIKSRLG